ncbi:MAG: HAD-IIIA family hydrolase [Zetaproteobacteria bacterium]|nr:MAG: HAD-IIIA family hydrolase [Zetaproteobacteria bacterium]
MRAYSGYCFPFERARGIRLLILDVDGVLTDGSIVMNHAGQELKAFNVRDGHGIKLLQRAGIDVAIITGRTSEVVRARADDLGIAHVLQGCLNKNEALDCLQRESGVPPTSCAYMGDDIIDLPPMRRCALAMAPVDAHPAVRARAHWVSDCVGGRGAVRQAAEALILAQGCWQQVMADRYGVLPQDCGWEV